MLDLPGVHSDIACELGEGPLWHPERQALYWFDIDNNRMFCSEAGQVEVTPLRCTASACGWVSDRQLLLAQDHKLKLFDIATGQHQEVAPLEADNPLTRSNDGRADFWGGFWIGTMGRNAEPGAGKIYRWYSGELRVLHDGITIPNATCFAPDAPVAYWTDTPTQVIMRQALDPKTGWPAAEAEPFIHFAADERPDGAVTDAVGNLWIALWGKGEVVVHDPSGKRIASHSFPAPQLTCPAFGGRDFTTLYVTSAWEGIDPKERGASGQTFALEGVGQGRPEPRVVL